MRSNFGNVMSNTCAWTAENHGSIEKVLVANRGEIALRLIRSVHEIGLQSVAVYTTSDSGSPHIRQAYESVLIGSESTEYNNIGALVKAAVKSGARAILPGYGFISENPNAARAFEKAGIKWVGPSPNQIESFASKTEAHALAESVNVPTVPGTGTITGTKSVLEFGENHGYPILIKASEGGGGMGQSVVNRKEGVEHTVEAVRAQSLSLFASSKIFAEKFIPRARHIEVQIFGLGDGQVLVLGLRDCSVQRRRQKVVEEGPPPYLDPSIADKMKTSAVKLCSAKKYCSAGTVEFLLDLTTSEYYFLEVNTRLQVEHGVTELTTGVDIVKLMLNQALQRGLPQEIPKETGSCIQARVYAENPAKDFLPSAGFLSEMQWPTESNEGETMIRVDSWAVQGSEVTAFFDPLLGKIMAYAPTRNMAIEALKGALQKTRVRGVCSNVDAVLQILNTDRFVKGKYDTGIMDTISFENALVEVLSPGLQSSLQDYPGRIGYWSVGVSPSGPMDAYAMNIANSLVGNDLNATALEMTVTGSVLKFHTDAVIALTGARFEGEYDDGRPVPWWTPFAVTAGTILELGSVQSESGEKSEDFDPRFDTRVGGKFSYLAIRGGFDAPKYLGSSSTFPVAGFGGEHGRFLQAGDFLSLNSNENESKLEKGWEINKILPVDLIPRYEKEIIVGALSGPHASEEFFDAQTISGMWTEPYTVHHAANRLGVRLHGPTPHWNRSDGGSAGLHPSNLHDYTYAPGAVNYSGNTPIVLMLDGPSLGGFVCPITLSTAEFWKISQATPGTIVRFRHVGYDDAQTAMRKMKDVWEAVRKGDKSSSANIASRWSPSWVRKVKSSNSSAIIAENSLESGDRKEMKVQYRMSGDQHVLVEYGEIELDLAYRLRVHTLMVALESYSWALELCPGVRSLLIRYDPEKIHVHELVKELQEIERRSTDQIDTLTVPSRTVHLPLAFDCQWTKDALKRYSTSVRPKAPYLPSNIEFTRRMNGLKSITDVRNIMLEAEYCVMGLGDVYLGAPCAVPLDPRHRLITTKMAPARLFTHEGTVGIGGSYMCIYGMDSPGGYQLMGRTLPIWDTYGEIPESHRGSTKEKPWLLRFFDRVKFYLVTDDELKKLREKYKRGEVIIKITDGNFSYVNHQKFLKENKESIEKFREIQSKAFLQERSKWEEEGEATEDASAKHATSQSTQSQRGRTETGLPMFSVPVSPGVAATVFNISAKEEQVVEAGDVILTMESMKVELNIEAPISGVVKNIQVSKGDTTEADSALCYIQSSKEAAFGNMTIKHLRKMYKIGVLQLENTVKMMREGLTEVEGISLVQDKTLDQNLKSIRKLKGKKYFPLYGCPFVISVRNSTFKKEILSRLRNSGAVSVAEASTSAPALETISTKKVSFCVIELSEGLESEVGFACTIGNNCSIVSHTPKDTSSVESVINKS